MIQRKSICRQWTFGKAVKDPRARISKLLDEPIEELDQDWEWVVSDVCRFREYLRLYSLAYLDDQERSILMEMMLQCVNDVKAEFGFMPKFWLEVKVILIRDFRFLRKTVGYWGGISHFALPINSWAISKEMKKVYWHCINRRASLR